MGLNFPFNVYCAAATAATATSLITLPFWRAWCIRIGLVDEPGHRKIHERPIALAGGLAVMTGILVPTLLATLLLWYEDSHSPAQASPVPAAAIAHAARPAGLPANTVGKLSHGLNRRAIELAGILGGAVGMLLVGLVDDKRELPPRAKFIGQVLVAGLVAASGARITLFIHSEILHYALTMLWIVAVINAFNFMDNMNGLCAGLGAIGAWYFALLAAAADQYLVALLALLTFGALVGFLPYNFPRARAFLGDAGSHLVGYLLAVLAILPHFYTPRHPRHFAVLLPLLVLAVPLADMAWVAFHRWRNGRPFYVGDTNHLSHRLVRLGLSRTTAVLLIWLLAALLGSLACLG